MHNAPVDYPGLVLEEAACKCNAVVAADISLVSAKDGKKVTAATQFRYRGRCTCTAATTVGR
jgi:hypothetical protein